MMIPKAFDKDITMSQTWREEAARYFDDDHAGMRRVMGVWSVFEVPVTQELLKVECARNFLAFRDLLPKWKHLYWALKKPAEEDALITAE